MLPADLSQSARSPVGAMLVLPSLPCIITTIKGCRSLSALRRLLIRLCERLFFFFFILMGNKFSFVNASHCLRGAPHGKPEGEVMGWISTNVRWLCDLWRLQLIRAESGQGSGGDWFSSERDAWLICVFCVCPARFVQLGGQLDDRPKH